LPKQLEKIESVETELSTVLLRELCDDPKAMQRERMCMLVAELVETNQELRFTVAQLMREVARLERELLDQMPWVGMLI